MTDWKILRNKFFRECCQTIGGMPRVMVAPRDLFEWFKDNIERQDKEENAALNKIGVFKREDLNPEFLKSIDSIENAIRPIAKSRIKCKGCFYDNYNTTSRDICFPCIENNFANRTENKPKK